MKNINKFYKYFFALFILMACNEELRDLSFTDSIAPPSNVSAAYDLTQDNTGNVTITPTADGALSFEVYFGDSTTEPAKLGLGENVTHTYAEGSYNVKIVAINLKGDKVEATQPLVVSFKAPENLMVTIENDAAISKQVNVTATADFAATYEFHSGETGVTQPVATANIGDQLSYQYSIPGTYSVKVVAKGAAIATTEYTMDFEVTEILAPIASATPPPTRSATDVISIFSDTYTNVAGSDLYPNWAQSTQYTAFDLNGDAIIQYSNLNYQGIQIGATQDLSSMEFLHMDIWTADAADIETYLISIGSGEKFIKSTLTKDDWTSIEIPLSDFTSQGLTINDIHQFKFVGAGTVFIDNIYFYKSSSASTFDDGILSNGDFSSGSDSWIVGVDDNAPAPVVNASGNSYYSVSIPNAGNPWEVNVSQKVEIIDGNTYTLTFDAWSNVNRSMIAGVGLSADPWSSETETINITPTKTTYTVTKTVAGWGAPDARVLFDLGADAGDVNIDNVSLFIGNGNMVVNGNFENGAAPWIIGVDDNASAPVVNTNGNNHYYVNVAAAGNPWEVNLSQKLEIIDGETYTLTFDAWSDVNRSIISGIGLSADPWSSETETINITPSRTTYSITKTVTGWGATDARVIFDLGAAAGEVFIDNVSLSKL